MQNESITTINESTPEKDFEDVETVIRFTNEGRRPVTNKLIIGPSMKKDCVGDYSCCGAVP